MKMFYFTLLAIIGILLSACATNSPSLQGNWKLISYGNANSPTDALPDIETVILFGEGNLLSGDVGCNAFGAGYEIVENNISIQAISSTKMYCKGIAEQESTVFTILSNQQLSIEISGNQLTLTSPDGSFVIVLERK